MLGIARSGARTPPVRPGKPLDLMSSPWRKRPPVCHPDVSGAQRKDLEREAHHNTPVSSAFSADAHRLRRVQRSRPIRDPSNEALEQKPSSLVAALRGGPSPG